LVTTTRLGLALFVAGLGSVATTAHAAATEAIWQLGDPRMQEQWHPEVIGAPVALEEPAVGRVMRFNGTADAFLLPAIPFAGWSTFTIQVLFKPEAGGLQAQRFFHAEDSKGSRVMIETRLTPDNQWYLDTFMLSGTSQRAMIDEKKLHPTGRWFWVTLRYDGKQMTSFVDGVKELEGPVAFAPMGEGKLSLGVRQNRVFWFKGAVKELRFTPEALATDKLQSAGSR
jgi:hypothetical protein